MRRVPNRCAATPAHLFFKFVLLGSASGGIDVSCGAKNYPDVFVRIDHSSNLKFIKFILAEYFDAHEGLPSSPGIF